MFLKSKMANQVRHLGVIMDGNRRWAKKHMYTSVMRGHEKGVETFIDLCSHCLEAKIPYLTVYAFSTENWQRQQEEVDALFSLMESFFRNDVELCIERGIRMRIIGDRSRLPEDSLRIVEQAEEMTAACENLYVQVAISYGGRDEIIRAANAWGRDLLSGKAGVLTEELFEGYLDTDGIPEIDLVIRTGGNRRLSNFFPWQTAYAELWFTDVLWPDFSRKDFQKALHYYENIKINKGK